MKKSGFETLLIEEAFKVLKHSRSPHSGLKVGAALLASGKNIYTGTNIEFDALTLTVCAERTALFSAITAGERKFSRLVIVTGSDKLKFPCGLCRQAFAEFNPLLEIIVLDKNRRMKRIILKDLLPYHFKLYGK